MPTGDAKPDILQGTLDLMVLRTLQTMGPQHGFGLAKRIQQISGDALSLNQGTLYPALLRLEQRGWIRSEWGVSEANRRAKFYELTRAGRRQVERESEDWARTVEIMQRFLRTGGIEAMSGLRRLSALLRGSRMDRELDDEIATHLAMQEEEFRARRHERRAQRGTRRGGSLAASHRPKELYRERRGLPWIETAAKDLRYAVRGLRQNQGFAAAAVLSLALGIGANTAIFSLFHALLLRMLPVDRPQELVMLYRTGAWGRGYSSFRSTSKSRSAIGPLSGRGSAQRHSSR